MESGEVFCDCRKDDDALIFRKRACRTIEGNTSHFGINFQAHEGESSDLEQPAWIYMGKSCQTNLIVSCDVVTSSVKEGKADNVVYLEFSKAFHVVSQRILVYNFKWMVRQKNLTESLIKRAYALSPLVTVEFLWGLAGLILSRMTWRKRWDAVQPGLWTDYT